VNVLIAEDEAIIRLDLKQMLEQHGFHVCGEARNGAEAVELARTLEPDVALLDLRMPVLDGAEAARRIYAERPIPIVMLTAFSDRGSVEKAISAGVFTYVTKPFREADLMPAIRLAVARHTELLAARREVGGTPPPKAIEIGLRSQSGDLWPLRVQRRSDGSLAVVVDGDQA
jgi:two-component system, response regulator PdtaR